jgi:hypothetical protein
LGRKRMPVFRGLLQFRVRCLSKLSPGALGIRSEG